MNSMPCDTKLLKFHLSFWDKATICYKFAYDVLIKAELYALSLHKKVNFYTKY